MKLIYSMTFGVLVCFLFACDQAPSDPPSQTKALPAPATPAQFVGAQVCGGCHEAERNQWQGSHHQLAMQPADANTILGDFNNTTFSHQGTTTTFFQRDKGFWIKTTGPEGKPQEFQVTYTFGVSPLQQYLIEFDDGRLQALGIAWDSRPDKHGGQRWYHLYPDQPVDINHHLHWTKPDQNWNYMCAECHSTQLRKQYDAESDTFNTTYSELNVACEACHGPGSNHVSWAQQRSESSHHQDKGLLVTFDERNNVSWLLDASTRKPKRSEPRTSEKEIDTCARCHSRRGILSEDYQPGKPIGNTHRVALLTTELYHPDGQPKDENYVYGSFLQSRMHQAGVTCSDCHNPHSLSLKLPGDQVCSQCHDESQYANSAHHFHEAASTGSSCVNCHMPVTRFMGVDDRHDHSFRIPRPDLSEQLGSGNTCIQCHQDQTHQWAAEQILKHHPQQTPGLQRYGTILQRARQGDPKIKPELIALARDSQQPAIARATAVNLLAGFPSEQTLNTIVALTSDANPFVRRSAAESMAYVEPEFRAATLAPLLVDSVRDVRNAAALALVEGGSSQYLNSSQRVKLEIALEEYMSTQKINADRAEAWFNLGRLYGDQGKLELAVKAYLTTLEKDDQFIPAVVNLANLYEHTKSPTTAETLLREHLQRQPKAGALYHALGLTHLRQRDYASAHDALLKAVELEPDNARFTYVLAVMSFSLDEPAKGFELLERNATKHPYDYDTLSALVSYANEYQQPERLQRYLPRLRAFSAD